jgi:hypothetical protein
LKPFQAAKEAQAAAAATQVRVEPNLPPGIDFMISDDKFSGIFLSSNFGPISNHKN